MDEFVIFCAKVLFGAFILFSLARVFKVILIDRPSWVWVMLVGVLAITNMIVHRLLGSSINPQFYTAVLFGVTLSGLTPADIPMPPSHKRAIYAVFIGTIAGYCSYIEVFRAGKWVAIWP